MSVRWAYLKVTVVSLNLRNRISPVMLVALCKPAEGRMLKSFTYNGRGLCCPFIAPELAGRLLCGLQKLGMALPPLQHTI